MNEKLKCCLHILLAKQYAVFTAGEKPKSKLTSCFLRVKQKAFLEAVIHYSTKVSNVVKEKHL